MNTAPSPMNAHICPQCGCDTPSDEGLRRWCERCNWNVTAPEDIEAHDLLMRKYRELGERQGRSVLAELIAVPGEALRPRLTPTIIAAFAIAGLIHLLSVAILISGLLMAFRGYPDPGYLVWGAFCVVLGWLMLPRPISLPKNRVAPEAFPVFRGLVDDIVAKLGGSPIRHIVIDETFNASYALAGWRRQPVLRLGLPLWIALSPQERVAVIAHEIAHGVNGDSTRGFMIGSALAALGECIGLLQPRHRTMTRSELLAGYLTWLFSLPLLLVESLLMHLLFQHGQRAEYFADYLAASLAGTQATVSVLQRFALGEHLHDVLLRNAYSTAQSGSYILDLFRKGVACYSSAIWPRRDGGRVSNGRRSDGFRRQCRWPAEPCHWRCP